MVAAILSNFAMKATKIIAILRTADSMNTATLECILATISVLLMVSTRIMPILIIMHQHGQVANSLFIYLESINRPLSCPRNESEANDVLVHFVGVSKVHNIDQKLYTVQRLVYRWLRNSLDPGA